MRIAAAKSLLTAEELSQRDTRRFRRDARVRAVWSVSAMILVALVAGILGLILVKGIPAINWAFLSTGPTEGMSQGGIWPMIRGSMLLIVGSAMISLPLGILCGMYFAYYARPNRVTGFIRSCLVGLAGTPSIIFGLFGLALFVIGWGFGTSLIAGCLTLAAFSLPTVIITSESALASVPISYIEGGDALGLPQANTICRIALPIALPNIITGIVLAVGRAVGEAPPIILTCGVFYSTAELGWNLETLRQPVANLAYHLAEGYRQGGQIPEKIVWGTCLVLVSILLLINIVAAWARSNRHHPSEH